MTSPTAKILMIIGPTAVGKTDFALSAANHLLQLGKVTGVDLISADSRQVYQGLEIISGADIPEGFQPQIPADFSDDKIFFEHGALRLFGISMLPPTAEWSVSQFQTYAQRIISTSVAQQRLPIIVGGTGLYQRHLFNTDPQLHIPPNAVVRERAEQMSVSELQIWLQEVNPERFKHMNDSDQANPRRLVRAIEISLAEQPVTPAEPEVVFQPELRILGLQDTIEQITERIQQRVEARLAHGAVAEAERLLQIATDQNRRLPAFSATGVKPLLQLVSGSISETEATALWITQERQYAKRQLTWWKKESQVKWYQITEPNWQQAALSEINSWYTT